MLEHAVSASYLSGISLRATAAAHGLSREGVEKILSLAGVGLRSRTSHMTGRTDLWRDRDLMRQLYVVERKSALQIAKTLGCDRSVITEWLGRHGIPARSLREAHLGQKPTMAGKGKRNSSEIILCGCGCGARLKRFGRNSNERRFSPGHHAKGALNANWKGGNTPIANATRATPAHREWRMSVLRRDDFTCQVCSSRGGRNLQAHHLDNYADHPERRFDAENGVTLCKPCHDHFHQRYGRRTKTTAVQFAEFKGAQR